MQLLDVIRLNCLAFLCSKEVQLKLHNNSDLLNLLFDVQILVFVQVNDNDTNDNNDDRSCSSCSNLIMIIIMKIIVIVIMCIRPRWPNG